MVANIGKISTMGGSTGLVDQTDKLHTGIIKTLESYNKGDACIGHAGITISAVGGFSTYTLEQPIHFLANNKYQKLTTDLTVSYDTTVKDANYTRYDWLLLNPDSFAADCATNHSSGLSDGSSTSVRHITKGSGVTISVGQTVTGDGIPSGAVVAVVNSATVFTLSADTTATSGSVSLTFGASLHIVRGTLSGANSLVADITSSGNGYITFIPIALCEITAGSSNSSTDIKTQLYTQNIVENSLSIGYQSGGYYTESARVTGTSTGTTLTNAVGDFIIDNTDSNDQIVARLGTNTSATGFEVRNNSDQTKFSVGGNGIVNIDSVTASRPLVVDSNKNIVSSSATSTELGYLSGASSAIQTQINALYARAGGNITGDVNIETAATSATAGKIALGVDLDTTTAIGNGATGDNKGIVVDLNATGDVNGNGATVSHVGTVNNTGIEIDVVGSTGGTQKNVGLDVAVSGADTNYAAIFNGGNVGIGNSGPSATLHIQSSSASTPQLLLESTDSGSSASPDMAFLRDSTDPINGDDLAHLKFMGKNKDAGNNSLATFTYADIFIEAQTVTKDSEDGKLHIRSVKAGAMDKRISLDASSTTFNEDSKDIDLRVEGNGDQELLVCSASNDNIGIGVTPTAQHTSKLTVEGSIMLRDRGAATADLQEYGQIWTKQATPNQLYFTNFAGNDIRLDEEVFIISLSDEATNLTAATGKASFHLPFAMTLTGVKATVNTAPTGRTIVVDINEAGNTILTTKLSIDVGEFSGGTASVTHTAATAAVIGGAGPALADNALLTFDIDHIGSSAAGKGLKVTLYGYRT